MSDEDSTGSTPSDIFAPTRMMIAEIQADLLAGDRVFRAKYYDEVTGSVRLDPVPIPEMIELLSTYVAGIQSSIAKLVQYVAVIDADLITLRRETTAPPPAPVADVRSHGGYL